MLVRRVATDDRAELAGVAALVWVAAEAPSTVADLVRELEADERAVTEAVTMLTAAGWLNEAAS